MWCCILLPQIDAVPTQIWRRARFTWIPLTVEGENLSRLSSPMHYLEHADLIADSRLGLCGFWLQITPSGWLKVITSQHVSPRAFNCCHNNRIRGDIGRAPHMASLSNEEEEAAFRPEGGRSCRGSSSCGKGLYFRGVSVHPAALPRERAENCGVSDYTTAPSCTDPFFWTAAGCETADGDFWRWLAAAVASDARGLVSLPCAGAGLWMGKDQRRKKKLLHVFTYEKEKSTPNDPALPPISN